MEAWRRGQRKRRDKPAWSSEFTQVTKVGLENLKGMTNLEDLDLSRTQVTDAGLEYLKGLTSLEVLSLSETQVTDTAVKKLQRALPNCIILHQPLTLTA